MIIAEANAIKQEIIDTTTKISDFNNKETQRKIDAKYTNIVYRACELVNTIQLLKLSTNFSISNDTLANLKKLVNGLCGFSRTKKVDGETTNDSIKLITSINSSLCSEWKYYYQKQSKQTLSTLDLIRNINPEQVASCEDKIQKGKEWSSSIEDKKTAFQALKKANDVIGSLNIDPEISNFLQKVSNNTATLINLTPTVEEWIEKQHLKAKIYISFK